MNSHLILSLKPICSTPFLSQIFGGRLYMDLWESLVLPRYYSWDIIKTRQASHGLTKTHQKGHWKIMFRGGGEKNTHFLDRWTCANDKEWSRGTNEVLVIGLHMVGKMSMGLDLEILLKFPNVARELGSFIIYIYFFTPFFLFFLFSSYFSFFIYVFFSFITFSLFSSFFFFYSPWTLDYTSTSLATPLLRHCSPRSKEVIMVPR
jgi:hypothetical protein